MYIQIRIYLYIYNKKELIRRPALKCFKRVYHFNARGRSVYISYIYTDCTPGVNDVPRSLITMT